MKRYILNFRHTILCLLLITSSQVFSQGAPACPEINAGPDQTVCPGVCATMAATVVSSYATTSYSVASIPNNPYPYSGGTAVSVSTDDVWSPVVNLPFNFCYFGNTYNTCILGSNGQLCFNTALASAYDGYPVTTTLPSTTDMPGNTICAVFRDIDPSSTGTMKYYLTGTAPCRALVVYWSNIPLFSCNTPHSTFQLVLYENTNFIDVYVQNSTKCAGWNSGYGIIGIQNAAASVAVCPPGRNRTAFTTTGEAWRFTPTGAASYTVGWSIPPSATVVATGLTPTFCPTATTDYLATMTLTNCDGSTLVRTDDINVVVNPGPTVNVSPSSTICQGSSTTLTASGASTYTWAPTTGLSPTTGASVTASPSSTTTYTVTGTTAGCTGTNTVTVTVQPPPMLTSVTVGACDPATSTFDLTGTISVTNPPASGTLIAKDCHGDQTTVATAPFSSSTYNFAINNINSDGAACNVEVYYSVNSSCSNTVNYTAPAPCTPLCSITDFEVYDTIQCDQLWKTDVTIEFTAPPSTGNLVVKDCQGNITVIQSAPFSSPATGTFSTTVGSTSPFNCDYTAYFTDDAGCSSVISFSPLPATPPADEAGTFSQSMTGDGTHTYILCDGDEFDMSNNGDSSIPPIAPGNDPSDIYFVYKCPPSPGGPGIDPTADPCYVGLISQAAITLINNGGSADGFLSSLGALTNQTFYLVPMTVGSLSGLTYSANCYDLATEATQIVQYLNPITYSQTSDCQAGTATVSNLQGGYPQFYGGNYTASGLTPATASFGNTTAGLGGSIVINGLNDGDNYSFTIKDGNGCPITITGTFIGTQDPSFTYPNTSYCTTAADPSPVITGVSGGTFTVSPSGVTVNASNGVIDLSSAPAGGTFTITYTTPSPTCSASTTFDVTINPQPTVSATPQSVCPGTQATLTGTGNATTYTWNNGITNGVAFTPPVGTTSYTVTGTSVAGCTNTATVNVTTYTLPTVVAGPDQSVCSGTAVTLSGSGATTYTWDNGVTNATSFTPAVGTITYTVTGTDGNGCTNTDQVNVTENPLPVIDAGADYSVCINTPITLSGSGAGAGGVYTWDNSVTDGVAFTPVGTKTYTVVGTDANGCTGTDQITVTVLPNAPINAGPDQAICNGASATITASGGTIYAWDNGLGAGASHVVTPVSTTTYTVTGTDAVGCTGTDQVVITVNPLPTVGAGVDQTVCSGTSVTLSGSGATTYTWDNGVTNGTAFTPAVGTITYTVTGTDGNNCTNTDQVNVTVNPLPVVNGGIDQTVCENTSITLTATGATTYTWNPGISNGVAFVPTVGTTTYTVIGTDANGCKNTDPVNVTVNALPVVNAGPDQSVCNGTQTTLAGSGATTYTWNNSVTDGVPFTQVLGSTTYTVTGTDGNGCINTDQVVITVNPNPNPIINGADQYCAGFTAGLDAGAGYTTYSWSTGATTETINATTADNPITVTVTNSFGCSTLSPVFTVAENSVITTNFSYQICQGDSKVIHGIAETTSGTYSQTYTSATGCDSTSNVTLTVNPLPNVNAGVDQAICIGASTSLTATGATTYVWDNGITQGTTFTPAVGTITYTVTGTDANGCINTDAVDVLVNPLPLVNAGTDQAICIGQATATLSGSNAQTYTWNNGVTNSVAFSPIVTDTYTVTGTDVNGCVNTDQVTVTVNSLPPVNAGLDQAVCDGFSVTLSGSGAGATGTYTWDNGVTNGVSFIQSVGTISYTVTGTDANGCTNTDMVQVLVNSLPVIVAGADQTVCNGTAVTLSGSGAGATGTYTWDNGVTNNVAFTQSVGTITYTVTGTDVNGCINTDNLDVTVNAIPVVNAGLDQAVCIGSQVTLTATGSTTYTWDNGITNGTAFTPAVGTITYTVTGTTLGCQSSDQVDVTVNPLPPVDAGVNFVSCEGQNVVLTGSGASSYTWDNGVSNGVDFVPAGTTTYHVIGTDANGCMNLDSVMITIIPTPVMDFTGNNLDGCSPLAASFTNNSTGNLVNCQWSFSNGQNLTGCGTVSETFINVGCYDVTLTVTTPEGCTNTLTKPSFACVEPNPVASFHTNPDKLSTIDWTAQMINTSTNSATYHWIFGDGSGSSTAFEPTHDFPHDDPGTYNIKLFVTSAFGCVDSTSRTVTVTDELIFYVPNTFTPDNDQFNETFKPVFATGYDPYDYTLYIFDRWGELLFESHNVDVGWDGTYGGKIVQDGTYIWKIIVKHKSSDKHEEHVGHINVLR